MISLFGEFYTGNGKPIKIVNVKILINKGKTKYCTLCSAIKEQKNWCERKEK